MAARGYQRQQLPRQGAAVLRGSIEEQARYLGPYPQLGLSARSEISRRCSAERSGFLSLGRARSLGAPKRWKRSLFIGFVQDALSSGLDREFR
eukprot:825872-Pyramimonas_sp.AAC.1